MKISYNWLKQYINIDISAEEISDILTNCGLEVESFEKIETIKGGLKGVVTGKVLTCEKHPDADKLSITTVDVGQDKPLNIVCGAPNVAAGQKVLVATIGTRLYKGEEEFSIKQTKIRGVVSEGMICAEDELGIGNSHDGIMVLDEKVEVGISAKEFFNIEEDYIFEIGLTPNRADATSHIGVARDIAAVINLKEQRNLKLNIPDVSTFTYDFSSDNKIGVQIDDLEACPRYSGLTIEGVTVKESPDWLKNRLLAIGARPINNIVDITNYVLFETGHPLHAFDSDKIEGRKIIVKKMPEGTEFQTLDGVVRKLNSDDLMICDTQKPLCIAGVFGGISSGVNFETKNVFIESAYFNPTNIRKTSKYHGLKTDASFRFERGADPNITLYALKRAALLIKEIAGGKIVSDIQDVYPVCINPVDVEIKYQNISKIIGKEIDKQTVKSICISLGMETLEESDKGLKIKIPTNKVDVTREIDVIEEILRIYGYNNIEINDELRTSISYSAKPDKEIIKNIVSDFLVSNGFYEIMNNSLTSSHYTTNSNIFLSQNNVKILNPLSKELDVMRQTLLYGGLQTIAYNINRKITNLKIFEFGNIYKFNPEKSADEEVTKRFTEEQHLSLFITGNVNNENWHTKTQKSDFYHLKSFLLNILKRLRINADSLILQQVENEIFIQSLTYSSNNKVVIEIGEVNKDVLTRFDIEQAVFYADINWELVLKMMPVKDPVFNELPKFPEVRRDLALLVDKSVNFSEISKIAWSTERKLLKSVNLFDVYEGEKIGAEKKSYAVSFIIQDSEKTLTDNQIDSIMNKLINSFKQKLGAEIR
jgi:phenylalanyl-tRNA synthetase beta chain